MGVSGRAPSFLQKKKTGQRQRGEEERTENRRGWERIKRRKKKTSGKGEGGGKGTTTLF